MFTLTATHLKTLCHLNEFPIREEEMVFLGFRGCLPPNPADQTFAASHSLSLASINYLNPRCTLVQWLPGEETFAVFPASTVPHQKYIQSAFSNGGQGANELLTGYYTDFRKGRHKGFKSTGHEAFVQTNNRPYRRTVDNLTYDPLDRVEMDNPGDNLHCGWFGGLDAGYSSAGCQVVMGFPQCAQRSDEPNTGPWKVFHDEAYKRDQQSFGYALLNGTEVQRLVLSGAGGMERVRFGSEGERTSRVQTALKEKGYYEGDVEGQFGLRSLRALLNFQEATFGTGGDDGICGPQTAEALHLTFP